jgi:Contractile injection system tube protein/LysM domain
MEKAKIQPLNAQGGNLGDAIQVNFNPTEYSIETSNQFQRTALPGTATPITQFVSGNTQTLTLDLFFDSYENVGYAIDTRDDKDVRKYTKRVVSLLNINPVLHAPPVCIFSWGTLSFKGTIEQVTQNFTLFLSDGTPVRATLSVTFQEYKTFSEQASGVHKESSDRTKRIAVKQGDRLWQIANQEYEDPSLWRSIANANKISNPRIIAVGAELVIPILK